MKSESFSASKRSHRRRAPLEIENAPSNATPPKQTQGVIRKAVFPVAGLDTGLLPATKAAPKEMLTVVDKPLIHYAVEEAVAAGVKEMIFVTNRNKRAIEDHFDMAYELEATLASEEREHELRDLRRLFPADVRYLYVRQREYTGLGSAIRCARPLVGDEPFAVILPDVLIDAQRPAIAQLIESFSTMHEPVIGVQPARDGDVAVDTLKTGVSYREHNHHVVRFSRDGDAEPGSLIAAGRYVLTEAIFRYLEQIPPAGSAEVGLHRALQAMLSDQALVACEIVGQRFSCRTKLDLLSATVHYGLKHPELAAPFRELLHQLSAAPSFPGLAPTHA